MKESKNNEGSISLYGVEIQKILDAVYESAEIGKEVTVE